METVAVLFLVKQAGPLRASARGHHADHRDQEQRRDSVGTLAPSGIEGSHGLSVPVAIAWPVHKPGTNADWRAPV